MQEALELKAHQKAAEVELVRKEEAKYMSYIK